MANRTTSNLKIEQLRRALKEYGKEELSIFEDEYEKDAENNNRKLSETLARFSIENFLKDKYGKSNYKIGITDRIGDQGIDAVAFDTDKEVAVIAQSKWKGDLNKTFTKSEMLDFIRGVKYALDPNDNSPNSTLESIPLYNEFIDFLQVHSNAKVYIIVVASIKSELGKEANEQQGKLIKDLNDGLSEENFEFVYINYPILHQYISGSRSNVDFNLSIQQYGKYEDYPDNGDIGKKIFYGMVNTSEIAELYSSYQNRLFAENIRSRLSNSSINDGIKDTIIRNPGNFMLYNNGITIIAKKVKPSVYGASQTDIRTITLEGASIVNGAQTVSSLGSLYNTDKGENLKNARVFVRCIEVSEKSPDLANNITRYANTQNEATTQDFAYLDSKQHELKENLEQLGYTYNLRSSDEAAINDKKVITLKEAAIALACLKTESVRYVVAAKSNLGRLFAQSGKDAYYNHIFNSVNPYILIRATQVVSLATKACDQKIKDSGRSGPEGTIALHGRIPLAYLILRHMQENNKNLLERQNFNHEDNFTSKVSNLIDKYMPAMVEVYTKDEELKSSFPGYIFKNQTKTYSLLEQAYNIVDQ